MPPHKRKIQAPLKARQPFFFLFLTVVSSLLSLLSLLSFRHDMETQNVAAERLASFTAVKHNSYYLQKSQDPTTQSSIHKIPHRLVFTYKFNLLETPLSPEMELEKRYYDNVMNTVNLYRKAWNEPKAPIWFLDDTDCRALVQEAEPGLVIYFDQERKGEFKSDMCRAAALYLQGGYYFDIDMEALEAVQLDPNITFASVIMQDGKFFQSFMASEPKSPILKHSLRLMREFCDESIQLDNDFISDKGKSLKEIVAIHEHKLQTNVSDYCSQFVNFLDEDCGAVRLKADEMSIDNLKSRYRKIFLKLSSNHFLSGSILIGPGSLRKAYDSVVDNSMKRHTFFLHELNLNTMVYQDLYPDLARQQGRGYCNYVVHDPEEEKAYFFSRMVGVPRCAFAPNMTSPKPDLRRPNAKLTREHGIPVIRYFRPNISQALHPRRHSPN